MSFEIIYASEVVKKDIPKLDSEIKERIKKSVLEKLRTKPEIFGKLLHKPFQNFRKLRIGNYRVIFKIEGYIVKVTLIQHRSVAYKNFLKRI